MDTDQIALAEENLVLAKTTLCEAERKRDAAESYLEENCRYTHCSEARVFAEIRVADANVSLSDAKVNLATAKLELSEAKIQAAKTSEAPISVRRLLLEERSRHQIALEQAQDLHQISIKALSNVHDLVKAGRGANTHARCTCMGLICDKCGETALSENSTISPDTWTSTSASKYTKGLLPFGTGLALWESLFAATEKRDRNRNVPEQESGYKALDRNHAQIQRLGSFQRAEFETVPPGRDQLFVWGLMDYLAELAQQASARAAPSLICSSLFVFQEAGGGTANDNRRPTLAQAAEGRREESMCLACSKPQDKVAQGRPVGDPCATTLC